MMEARKHLERPESTSWGYETLTTVGPYARMALLGIIAAFVFIVWHPDESYALADMVCP
jgi:hypothetical protein